MNPDATLASFRNHEMKVDVATEGKEPASPLLAHIARQSLFPGYSQNFTS